MIENNIDAEFDLENHLSKKYDKKTFKPRWINNIKILLYGALGLLGVSKTFNFPSVMDTVNPYIYWGLTILAVAPIIKKVFEPMKEENLDFKREVYEVKQEDKDDEVSKNKTNNVVLLPQVLTSVKDEVSLNKSNIIKMEHYYEDDVETKDDVVYNTYEDMKECITELKRCYKTPRENYSDEELYTFVGNAYVAFEEIDKVDIFPDIMFELVKETFAEALIEKQEDVCIEDYVNQFDSFVENNKFYIEEICICKEDVQYIKEYCSSKK